MEPVTNFVEPGAGGGFVCLSSPGATHTNRTDDFVAYFDRQPGGENIMCSGGGKSARLRRLQLFQDSCEIDLVPVFRQLSALNPPNVDRAEFYLFAGRLNSEKRTMLCSRVGTSRDNLIAAEDAILHDEMQVGKRRVEAACVLDMRGKAGRVAAGSL
jgi:hypothetical protein